MGRIIGYPYDQAIEDGDAWVGTEASSALTKQYTAQKVADYLNVKGKVSVVGQMTYRYVMQPLLEQGTFALVGGGANVEPFSGITKLTLSAKDIGEQRTVEFLSLLVGSDFLISKQSELSIFGYYSIGSYSVNATNPDYYDMGVTFKEGNGSLIAGETYEAQNFTLANDATQSPWERVPGGISYPVGKAFAEFLESTSFIKTGGTPTQFLMADGSVSLGSPSRYYKVFEYAAEYLTYVTTYEDVTLAKRLFLKTLTYTTGRLTQSEVLNDATGVTTTKTFAYDSAGNLINTTKL
jgi:hypothetical protein